MADELFAIEPADRRPFNDLIDWWQRVAVNGPQFAGGGGAEAVPLMILQAPEGWTLGRYAPMVVDPLYPYSYDVCLIGYPAAYNAGQIQPGTFRVAWQGVQSEPIPFNATAVQFRAALPQPLRDLCKVTGGTITDTVGTGATYYPGRWFVSLPERFPGLTALPLTAGTLDTVVLRVSESPLSVAPMVFPCWCLVNRTTSPRIAAGALGIGWYTQSLGLMIGAIEPRIYEEYSGVIYQPTTTTTAAPTGPTTTTTAGPATTTTAGPATTTAAPGTTTAAPGTTTTANPSTTTTTFIFSTAPPEAPGMSVSPTTTTGSIGTAAPTTTTSGNQFYPVFP